MADESFPIKKILLAAVMAPFSYGGVLLRKSIPGAVALVVGFLIIGGLGFFSDGESAPGALIAILAILICFPCVIYGFTILAITFHRIFLLGAQAVPGFGLTSWGSREWRFFGWGIGLSLLTGLMMIPLIFALGLFISNTGLPGTGDSASFSEIGAIWAIWSFVFTLPAVYVFSRWSVIFPATATDSQPNLGWSWDFTSKYHWQVALVVGFTTAAIETVAGILIIMLPAWLAALGNIVISLYLAIFGIAVLSFSYGWLRDAQPDLLPPETVEN